MRHFAQLLDGRVDDGDSVGKSVSPRRTLWAILWAVVPLAASSFKPGETCTFVALDVLRVLEVSFRPFRLAQGVKVLDLCFSSGLLRFKVLGKAL